MDKFSPEIQSLRTDIEQLMGHAMRTPADFNLLSLQVWNDCHENISPTTLKRLWGYIDGAAIPRHNTLSVLSRLLGYGEWDDYLRQLPIRNNIESELFTGDGIRSSELKKGESIEVAWLPNRCCVFRYEGEQRFTVMESSNSKLQVGDTFAAACFLVGRPMHLDNIVRNGQALMNYVAGKKHGLTYAKRIDK